MVRNSLTLMAGLLSLLLAVPALPTIAAPPTKPAAAGPGPQLIAEAASQPLCESVAHRIFVTHFVGTECIAFYATPASTAAKATVVYFNGDVPDAYFRKPRELDAYLKELNTTARFLAERQGVRIIFVARPGTFGSSGDHELRGERREMMIMNAAVDALKSRLGLDQLVLAGQSRGSQVAAALLTMRRTDVRCAVLGSGTLLTVENERRFQLSKGRRVSEDRLRDIFYDPSRYLAEVVRDADRRILILGDRADTITPFDQQMAFGDRLKELGHHARTFEIMAQGRDMHGATHLTLPVAALCAKGAPDEQIAWIVTPPGKVAPAPGPRPPLPRAETREVPPS
ncbi:MAG: alpha/beta hydrolase family protein [Hyphomicrobiaceae bacterium]